MCHPCTRASEVSSFTMTGKLLGSLSQTSVVWLFLLVLSFVMSIGNKTQRLIKFIKLSTVGLVLYNLLTCREVLPKPAGRSGQAKEDIRCLKNLY